MYKTLFRFLRNSHFARHTHPPRKAEHGEYLRMQIKAFLMVLRWQYTNTAQSILVRSRILCCECDEYIELHMNCFECGCGDYDDSTVPGNRKRRQWMNVLKYNDDIINGTIPVSIVQMSRKFCVLFALLCVCINLPLSTMRITYVLCVNAIICVWTRMNVTVDCFELWTVNCVWLCKSGIRYKE